jgi:hypothetical protein
MTSSCEELGLRLRDLQQTTLVTMVLPDGEIMVLPASTALSHTVKTSPDSYADSRSAG